MKQTGHAKLAMLCYPRRSGITHYTYCLAAELAARLPELCLVVNRAVVMRPVKVTCREIGLFTRTRWLWLDFTRLIALLLKERIGYVHFQSALKNWYYDFPLLMALKLCGRKIIFTAHDVLPHTRRAFETGFIRSLYRLFDLVIVHSEHSAGVLAGLGVPTERVRVIPHGLYSMFLPQRPVTQAAARKALGLAPRGKVLLFFGSINPRKGAEKLVTGFDRVAKRQKDVTLVMAGTNDYPEGHLEGLLARKGIADRVKLFGTWVPDERVHLFFTAADMVLLPYDEGFTSGVLKLAYAFQKPVATSGVGELARVVASEKTGLVLDAFFSEATARRILETLNSKVHMGVFQKNIARLAQEKYAWNAIAAKTVAAYASRFPEFAAQQKGRHA